MGIRIGRRLEELAARFGGEPPKKKEPVKAPEYPDARPKRRLVRDEEAKQEVQRAEQRAEQQKIKEAKRAAAKEETAQRSPAQKMKDEFAIQKLLENTDGSKLQQKRLKEEDAVRRKRARGDKANLEARVEEDRERRIAPVHEFDRQQAQLEAEERTRAEAEEIERMERQAAELERVRNEQARNDADQGIYHEGNYAYFREDQASQDDEDDVGADEIDNAQYDDEPKQIGSRRMVQAEEDAVPRKDKPRARKSGVKPESSYLSIPAKTKGSVISFQKSRVQNRRELKEIEKMFGKDDSRNGAEPDYTAPEWVKFFEEAEARQQEKEKADAEDLHEIYEVLFDFYEGKDGKKGISAIDVNEIIFETEDNEIASKRYRNRWENITNPVVLEYPNSKGEKFGDILNRYLDMVFSFYRDNLDELQRSGAVDQHTDLPTMAQSALREIIHHGDTYNSSLNIPLTKTSPSYEFGQVVDPVIRYVDDACMKLEEHFDTRILNKLRTRLTDSDWRLYMKGLKLLNDLYEERQWLLSFRKRSQVAHQ